MRNNRVIPLGKVSAAAEKMPSSRRALLTSVDADDVVLEWLDGPLLEETGHKKTRRIVDEETGGERPEHSNGKYLIGEWAARQGSILPGSVIEEECLDGNRALRPDVQATLTDGRRIVFEVQRKRLSDKQWKRRHEGYRDHGVQDIWLWTPKEIMHPRLWEVPTNSLIFDPDLGTLGMLLVRQPYPVAPALVPHVDPVRLLEFVHPVHAVPGSLPTHYVSAPLSEWSLSEDGTMVPPSWMSGYLELGENDDYHALAQRQRVLSRLMPGNRHAWEKLQNYLPVEGWILQNEDASTLYLYRSKTTVAIIDRTMHFDPKEYQSVHAAHLRNRVRDIWLVNARDRLRLPVEKDSGIVPVHINGRFTVSIDGRVESLLDVIDSILFDARHGFGKVLPAIAMSVNASSDGARQRMTAGALRRNRSPRQHAEVVLNRFGSEYMVSGHEDSFRGMVTAHRRLVEETGKPTEIASVRRLR